MPRYIDAEVLRTEINGLRISGLGNKSPEWHDAMWKCLNIILETPTTDVREVLHGVWKKHDDGYVEYYECSHCLKGSAEYNFCPWCGAKMGEKNKDA